jgi:hypothetical protein
MYIWANQKRMKDNLENFQYFMNVFFFPRSSDLLVDEHLRLLVDPYFVSSIYGRFSLPSVPKGLNVNTPRQQPGVDIPQNNTITSTFIPSLGIPSSSSSSSSFSVGNVSPTLSNLSHRQNSEILIQHAPTGDPPRPTSAPSVTSDVHFSPSPSATPFLSQDTHASYTNDDLDSFVKMSTKESPSTSI